jgi:hypothetical protein
MLLIIGEAGLNPGLQVEKAKIDQILSYVKNREKEKKAIKELSEAYKLEISNIKKGTEALGTRFEKLSEMINEVITDYDQINQTVRGWVVKQQQLNRKVRFVQEEQRKINILIFGLQEEKNEGYLETLRIVKFLRDVMKVEITNWNTDYVTRLGRRIGERPILVRFTYFVKKLEVLKHMRTSVGITTTADDSSMEIWRIQSGLTPYLKDTKKNNTQPS